MFIDEAKIKVKAGDGGNGCMAFRREKFVPRGGPSGGDGGKGGDIIMESSERHNTLVHFRFNPEHTAQRGRHGEGSNKTGREGVDVLLKVPVGTIVYDDETGEKAFEFTEADQRYIIARGGRGGRGNARFATSVHQAPREHEDGRPGEEHIYRLELKGPFGRAGDDLAEPHAARRHPRLRPVLLADEIRLGRGVPSLEHADRFREVAVRQLELERHALAEVG